MAPIKVGLMGCGSSTKYFHLPFILPNPDLHVAAFLQRAEAPKDTSDVEPGKHCTVDHPHAKHYRTAEDFFADDEIELVIVCTSSAMHFEFGKQALLAGKHGMLHLPHHHATLALTYHSRHREALHSHDSRSRQIDRAVQRKEQNPNRLPKPPLRLRLPHPPASDEPQPQPVRHNHRI